MSFGKRGGGHAEVIEGRFVGICVSKKCVTGEIYPARTAWQRQVHSASKRMFLYEHNTQQCLHDGSSATFDVSDLIRANESSGEPCVRARQAPAPHLNPGKIYGAVFPAICGIQRVAWGCLIHIGSHPQRILWLGR